MEQREMLTQAVKEAQATLVKMTAEMSDMPSSTAPLVHMALLHKMGAFVNEKR
jgi:hypothetical protein